MEKISAMSCNRNGFTLVEMMEADLSQALARTYRDDRGDRMPAFASETGGPEAAFLKFTRGGQSNINGEARSNLERVEYRLKDGNLERWRYRMTDGGAIDQSAILISKIESLQQGRPYRHLFLVGTGYL